MKLRGFERQIARGSGNRILTPTRVWSLEGPWPMYHIRSDPAGDVFGGLTFEMEQVEAGQAREWFRARKGAHWGVARFHASANRVVFPDGRGHPSRDWSDGPVHRQERIRELSRPGRALSLVRACEESRIGVQGSVRPDSSRLRRALAFQGTVLSARGRPVPEVFLVDLPEDVTRPGRGPRAGKDRRLPRPPAETVQHRLPFSTERNSPGPQGPRHRLEGSPDGRDMVFLMTDDAGVVPRWAVSPRGGLPRGVTHDPWPVASAFSGHPTGRWLAHVRDGSVCVRNVATGRTRRLTERRHGPSTPRPEACAFSPHGRCIAFVRPRRVWDRWCGQIGVVEWEVA